MLTLCIGYDDEGQHKLLAKAIILDTQKYGQLIKCILLCYSSYFFNSINR